MKAIGYQQSLDIQHPDSLLDITLTKPTAIGRDLLVKVEAISVNPVDTKVRQRAAPESGSYKVLGWDAVGEVIEIGEEVEFYRPGDKVFYAGDLTRPGTYAEFHLVDERIVGAKPKTLSNVETAALPLTSITAWELLFDRLGVEKTDSQNTKSNQSILIIGAAGGVGSILIQLAAQLTSLTVIATASRPESQVWVKQLGADHVINHHQPIPEQLKQLDVEPVTYVASLTGTDQHFDAIVECIAPQGKLALIDDPGIPLDIKKLKQKSVSLHWEFMYTRSMFNTEDIAKQRELLNEVSHYLENGILCTTYREHYGAINAANLKQAHAALESGKVIGKIVLEGFQGR